MGVSYDGGYLTKAKGSDDELVWVKFNNGASRPMKKARKRCLDDADKLQKTIHHLPSPEEWQKESHFASLGTVDELFGSFDAMLKELKRYKSPSKVAQSLTTVKVYKVTEEGNEELKDTLVLEPDSVEKRKARRQMIKKQTFSDRQLAEILHRACGGQVYITKNQYDVWRDSQKETVPTSNTIATRLGKGFWDISIFHRMRQLLTAEVNTKPKPELKPKFEPKPEPKLEPKPEPKPEPEPEPEPRLEPEPEPEFEPEPEPEPDPEPEPEPKNPEPKPKPKSAPKLINLTGDSVKVHWPKDYGQIIEEGNWPKDKAIVVTYKTKFELVKGKHVLSDYEELKVLRADGRIDPFPDPEENVYILVKKYIIPIAMCTGRTTTDLVYPYENRNGETMLGQIYPHGSNQ